jgi:hypothetical protein
VTPPLPSHPVASLGLIAAIAQSSLKPIYMKLLCNAFIRLSFGLILLLTVAMANAQSGNSAAAPVVDAPVVRYLGAQDDMLIFNVSYNNPLGNKFVVTILDQNGNRLYQDLFRDRTFYRQFKLPKTDKDLITFSFRNGQDAPVEKRFEVNVNSHFVQEVAIKKL